MTGSKTVLTMGLRYSGGGLPRLLLTCFLAATLFSARAGSTLTLDDLLRLGLSANPAVLAARDQVAAARGMAQTARAYPNPEISGQSGHGQEREVPDPHSGSVYTIALNQPLEYPMVRTPRIEAADASLSAADAARQSFENDAAAAIKLAYYDLLRRQAEAAAAKEDLQLTQQIRDNIALRYGTGESPKFDLITAETELLNARKNRDMASLRVLQARISLRQAVGKPIPEDAQVTGELPSAVSMPPLATLQEELQARNPDLQRTEAEGRAAESRVDLEKAQRLPKISLLAQRDVDPTLSSSRVGMAVTIPIWDRRSGQVMQAQAELSRNRNLLDSQRLSLSESLAAAYGRFQIAGSQVSMLENELLAQAAAAQKIAEAAYRYGERGILEWLNAQRTYRAARNELITARYDLAAVTVEIDRIRAQPVSTSASIKP
ncbi:MAG: TolC family protein [Betaproteobacteria bacterium]|nr:TolC family protein [Betaproteobacteria bacterium]MDE2131277.1 TolC family protein [Betaproteobacteria bacterium]MDE2211467.1 TolC family protein [Betaproteobacteria bacterium]